MVKLVAVSIVVVCLSLVATLAEWVQSAPTSSPISASGHLQRRSSLASVVPIQSAALQPLLIGSQSDRFKRQSAVAATQAPTISSTGSSSSSNNSSSNSKKKKKKKNKKNKNIKRLLAECLVAHNKFRRQHRVPDLEWDDKLAEFAQKRSNHIAASDGAAFGHPPDLPFGENLFWHSSVDTACEYMIRGWYDEIGLYDFRAPTFAPATGHFTQLIWRTTTRVGCAFATSSGKRGGIYLTCNYDPPGNFVGEFTENVPLPVQTQPSIETAPTQVVAKPPPPPPTTTTSTTTTTTSTTTTSTTTQRPVTTTTVAAAAVAAGDKPADTPTTKPKKKSNKKKKKKKKKNNKKNKKTTTTTSTTASPVSTNTGTSATSAWPVAG